MPLMSRIGPSADAQELAGLMAESDDVMRQILTETLPDENDAKVHESGRTICGKPGEIHGPLARFPTAVELSQCPRGVRGGTWHSHVTKEELRNPTNSLPDTANVIFGHIDVSIVVGTQSMEMVMAAEDPEAAKERFQNILGANVESTDDVISSVISGDVPDPKSARNRLRSELGGLFERRQTGFGDLDRQVNQSSIEASSIISFEIHEAMHYERLTAAGHGKNPIRDPAGFRNKVQDHKDRVKRKTDISEHVIDTVVSQTVLRAFNSIF